MALRVVSVVEKNIGVDHNFDIPIAVVAATPTDVLPDIKNNPADPTKEAAPINYEVAARYIQNIGANPTFFSYDIDCLGAQQNHGSIPAGGQLNASDCGGRISVFSPLGTTISRLVLKRNDMIAVSRLAKRNIV